MSIEQPIEEVEDPLAPAPRDPSILGDRFSPILVKEVRQALRGRLFKISFWFTLVAATLIGTSIIVNLSGTGQEDNLGEVFFTFIYSCLIIAVIGVVPFSAFLSMGAEWDENTYDLLVLSNLGPRQIVLGKLLSACVQAGLFFSAFGPFLVFAFLLRGIDIVAICVLLLLAALLSVTASTLSICLSSLTSLSFVRRMLMSTVAGILGMTCMGTIGFGGAMIGQPQELRDPDVIAGLSGMALFLIVLLAFAFAIACARLAHEEENRSTGLRALSSSALLLLVGYLFFMYPSYLDMENVVGLSCGGAFFAFCCGLFFCSEQESLGRRTRRQVPRNSVLAQLAVPFLPGGGRGMLLLLVQLVFLGGGIALLDSMTPVAGSGPMSEGALGYIVFALYVCLYLGVPCAVLNRISGDLRGRSVIRGAVLLLFVVATFLPMILGFFVDDRDLMQLEHPGHPFWLMSEVWSGQPSASESALIVALLVITGTALALNAPRMARGWHEVIGTRRRMLQTEQSEETDRVAELS